MIKYTVSKYSVTHIKNRSINKGKKEGEIALQNIPAHNKLSKIINSLYQSRKISEISEILLDTIEGERKWWEGERGTERERRREREILVVVKGK